MLRSYSLILSLVLLLTVSCSKKGSEQSVFSFSNISKVISSIIEGESEEYVLAKEHIGKCINSIEKDSEKFGVDLSSKINEIKASLESLDGEVEKIELLRDECYKTYIKLQGSKDSDAKSSGVRGAFEGVALRAMLLFRKDENVYYDLFKNVDVLKSSFEESEIRDHIRAVLNEEKKGPIKRAADIALRLCKDVIRKTLLTNGFPESQKTELENIVKGVTEDLTLCLSDANDSKALMNCTNKFARTAPAFTARFIQDEMVDTYFRDYFPNPDSYDETRSFEKLKLGAGYAYNHCVANYYYNDADDNYTERSQTCVYEGVLSAYNYTVDATMESLIADNLPDNSGLDEIREYIKDIKASMVLCPLKDEMNKVLKLELDDYKKLSKYDAKSFTDALFSCVEELTLLGGSFTVRKILESHEDIKTNLRNEDERSEFIDGVMANAYTPCVKAQIDAGFEADPLMCQSFIESYATLEITRRIVPISVNELVYNMLGFNDKSKAVAGRLVSKAIKALDSCQGEIKNTAITGFKDAIGHDVTRDTLGCISKTIESVAGRVAIIAAEDKIDNDPLFNKLDKEKVKNSHGVTRLTGVTNSCISEKFASLNDYSGLDRQVSTVIDSCAFKAEVIATKELVPMVLDAELKGMIPVQSERKAFIDTYLKGSNGFWARADRVKSQFEMNKLVGGVKVEVIRLYGEKLIPELVEDILKDTVSEAKINNLVRSVKSGLNSCLDNADSYDDKDKRVDTCVNITLKDAYFKVAVLLIGSTLENNMGEGSSEAASLTDLAEDRMRSCFNKISTDPSNKKLDEDMNKCIAHDAARISKDAALKILQSLSVLTGISELRGTGLSKSYGDYGLCVNRGLWKFQENPTIDELMIMTEKIGDCTSILMDGVIEVLKVRFLDTAFEGKRPEHSSMLRKGVELLMLTQKGGSSSGSVMMSEGEQRDILKLLKFAGQNMIYAYDYDPNGLLSAIDESEDILLEALRDNPETNLQTKLFYTPFMDIAIKANISISIKRMVPPALKDMDINLSRKEVDYIVSRDVMEKTLSNRYANMAFTYIRKLIIAGRADNLESDRKVLDFLSYSLTDDSSRGTFAEALFAAIVDQQLDGVRNSFMGRLAGFFGIINSKNLKWSKIRNTKSAKEALKIFSIDILRPVIQGNSFDDSKMDKVEKLLRKSLNEV